MPEYFPVVPRDYFTGEVMRYSAAARAVWSAGENDLVLASTDQKIPPRAIAMKLNPVEKRPNATAGKRTAATFPHDSS